MEFAGKEYIYLSKQKKEKIKKLRKSEEDNKGDAPPMSIEKEKAFHPKKKKKRKMKLILRTLMMLIFQLIQIILTLI